MQTDKYLKYPIVCTQYKTVKQHIILHTVSRSGSRTEDPYLDKQVDSGKANRANTEWASANSETEQTHAKETSWPAKSELYGQMRLAGIGVTAKDKEKVLSLLVFLSCSAQV